MSHRPGEEPFDGHHHRVDGPRRQPGLARLSAPSLKPLWRRVTQEAPAAGVRNALDVAQDAPDVVFRVLLAPQMRAVVAQMLAKALAAGRAPLRHQPRPNQALKQLTRHAIEPLPQVRRHGGPGRLDCDEFLQPKPQPSRGGLIPKPGDHDLTPVHDQPDVDVLALTLPAVTVHILVAKQPHCPPSR
ncbi:MAG TPA: hypothetical protein P5137_05785 [Candidatus Brocadiia bacterium]|nr:hypothetical protein [Candidatus Brocadiia bacterium]